MFAIIAFIISVSGYFVNGIPKYRKWSYVLWLTSNTIWIIYSVQRDLVLMASMFFIYNIFCLYNLKKEISMKT
jgi:hypothetical protein